jgi:predicted XRE-type DNA-binding protein
LTPEKEPIEIVHGSSNVFADLGYPDPDICQAKARLAIKIMQAMDAKRATEHKTQERLSMTASDFSRLRHGDFGHFTIDQLSTIWERLNDSNEVTS